MPEEVTECPVCLEIITKKWITSCNHIFCQDCIVKVFLSGDQKTCPICRNPLTLKDVRSVETNSTLFSLCGDLKLIGSVYVQGNTLGLASYHFDCENDCYISYASAHCMVWPSLDNGERPPAKKPFTNVSIDEDRRIFRGEIVWAPTSWHGDALWTYEMQFSEDYGSISGGRVVAYDSVEKNNVNDTHIFGTHLKYKRLYGNELMSLLSVEEEGTQFQPD